MVGSAQHSLAQWLVELLKPVRDLYATHCISDSFQFTQVIHNLEVSPSNSFLCSFDISSLFTNVPLL